MRGLRIAGVAVILAASAACAETQQDEGPILLPNAPASSTANSSPIKSPSTIQRSKSILSPIHLPYGIPPVNAILQTACSLQFQDIVVGTGPAGEDNQLWKVKYTGWRAADGVKFDSWDEHPQPIKGQDGKPVTGPDGKPEMDVPQPMEFPHGVGRMIPGFDLGIEGMRVGGKRRVFVPWALAYAYRVVPDRGPDRPGIPAKSDLIFDVELVAVAPLPAPPPTNKAD